MLYVAIVSIILYSHYYLLESQCSGDGSIKKTNKEIRSVIAAANNFAPTLRMDITMFTPPKNVLN